MTGRRLPACAALVMSFALLACRTLDRADSTSTQARKTTPTETPRPTPKLDFLHLALGGSKDEQLPWVVGFHGLGDTPENFAHVFDHLPVRAHLYLPRAPNAYGSGFDWFGARVADHERLTEGIQARLPDVAALIETLSSNPRNAGHAVVTGFSQGGILSFAIAAANLKHVKSALPIAGWLPPALASRPAMPVVAFHGESDSVVPFTSTHDLVTNWNQITPDSVAFHTYPNVQHTISAAMYKDWAKALQTALATAEH